MPGHQPQAGLRQRITRHPAQRCPLSIAWCRRRFLLTHCGSYSMVPAMKPVRAHNRPMVLGRLLCFALVVILLANPVLAVVLTAMDCKGQCCCSPGKGSGLTTTIISNRLASSGCCGPTGSVPCQLSSGTLPDAPLTLIQTNQEPSANAIRPLPSNRAAACPQPSSRPIAWVAAGPEFHPPPLYLKTCRLIC